MSSDITTPSATDIMVADLLRAGDTASAIQVFQQKLRDPAILESFPRKACFIDALISNLLNSGKLEVAIEVYKSQLTDASMLNAFTRKAFFNRSREALVPFILDQADHLDRTIAPVILRNMVTLAEMSGSLLKMSDALKRFQALFQDHNETDVPGWPDEVLTNAINAALGLFRIDIAAMLINYVRDSDRKQHFEDLLSRYNSACGFASINADDLRKGSISIMNGERLLVEEPTVVVRITPRIWDVLGRLESIDPGNLPDGLSLAKTLKQKGYNVVVAPQLSLPGPSLYTPFSRNQKHALAFVDCHKYSKIGPFVHYKSTHTKKILVERGGYSGWAEIQAHPELHKYDLVSHDDALAYCNAARTELFGSDNTRSEAISRFGKYAVVPLQIPGDSVQRLSSFTFYEMIDNTIKFFSSKNLNIVLRRHPQCQDREVATYLRQLAKYKNVFISDEPTRELIQHAEAVALCNSSVGWDAILAHKPLICFGLAEYSRVAHQVYEVSDLDEIEDLNSLVRPKQNDKFYYYFWHKYVVHGPRGIPAKATQLIDDIFLEASKKP